MPIQTTFEEKNNDTPAHSNANLNSPTNLNSSNDSTAENREKLAAVLKEVWGYDSFLPLQFEAMQSVMTGRDSLVVFPTGGGKSLCFQAPAVCQPGLGVVVSPLISLMKDQVDALKACGIRAAYLNSSLSRFDEDRVLDQIRGHDLQLVYMAPERLLTDRTHRILSSASVSFFAVDEAHCVSEWGHDFRPEYRGLAVLKKQYPGVAIHAYTATATEQVRQDISRQLGQCEVEILVGSMDRPNLNYQIRRRTNGLGQIVEVLNQHQGESGIVYVISRKDVESTCEALGALGFKAMPYHAGLSVESRNTAQEAFLTEEIDIIVATVAFGMGIDKSNVRYVIHASMPKSLEAYQQESGRAGRDGLDAECWMFYKPGDFMAWKRLVDKSDSGLAREAAVASLKSMSDYCSGVQCRHVALAAHFGEEMNTQDCGACDVCLNELDLIDDALVVAQKIVSCVHRVQQRFGAEYVAQILVGSKDKRILKNRHENLSTYGLLESSGRRAVRDWIEQLLGQQFLVTVGEYNVVNITDTGRRLLRGEITPRLARPDKFVASGSSQPGRSQKTTSWEGVDQSLFDELRALRAAESQRLDIPVHVVFSDAALRDMARRHPSTLQMFRLVHGVGQQKLDDFGQVFLDLIIRHCNANGLAFDVKVAVAATIEGKMPSRSGVVAFKHFDDGLSVPAVAEKMGRAESTTNGYLQEYINHRNIVDASRWVDPKTIERVTTAITAVGAEGLKPIFVALDEEIGYDEIRIVLECMNSKQRVAASSSS